MGRKGQVLGASMVVLASCGPMDTSDTSPRLDLVLASVDTLISTESALLAHPTDIDVGVDGDVYIADARANHIVHLPANGAAARTIGREGQGPGEFSRPSVVRSKPGGLLIFDRGNGRVQYLSREGNFLSVVEAPPQSLASPLYLQSDGGILVGSMGVDSSLVMSFDSSGSLRGLVGEPVVPPVSFFDFGSMKDRIARGEVPAEFRNNVLTAGAKDDGIWIVLQTEGEIRRYDPSGELLWRQTIDEPQIRISREQFFDRNSLIENPMSVAPLRAFADIFLVEDELWILLATEAPDPAVVLSMSVSGKVTRRLVIPAGTGAGALAYYAQEDLLLLGIPDDAQVLSVRIGG